MKRIMCILAALLILVSAVPVAVLAEDVDKTATVNLYDIYGNLCETREFELYNGFSVYTVVNASAFNSGKISAVAGSQTYNDSVLALADELNAKGYIKYKSDVFPILGNNVEDDAATSGVILFEANVMSIFDDPFVFDSDDDVLIKTTYTAERTGTANIVTTLGTLTEAGDLDREGYSIVENGQIKSDNLICFMSFEKPQSAESYALTVGTERVTAGNMSGEGWSFAPATNTLTLNGFNYSGEGRAFGSGSRAAISYLGDAKLNLIVENNNGINVSGNASNIYGIYSSAPLEFSGSGSLKILADGGSGSDDAYGVYCSGDALVTGGTVEATGMSNGNGYGFAANGGELSITNNVYSFVACGDASAISETSIVPFVSGMAWTDVAGTQGMTVIEDGVLRKLIDYRRIELPIVNGTLFVGNDYVPDRNSSGNGWSYVHDTNTLTLNGFNYSGEGRAFGSGSRAAISYLGDAKLNLVVENSNSINIRGSAPYLHGIYSRGALEVTGSGSLDIFTGETGVASSSTGYGIVCGSSLTVDGASLTAKVGSAVGSTGIHTGGDFVMKSGEVTARGGEFVVGITESNTYGIYCSGKFTVSGGKVYAAGGNKTTAWSYGVYAASGFTVSGGEVVACGGNEVSISYGVYVNSGKTSVDGGSVEAVGGSAAQSIGFVCKIRELTITKNVRSFVAVGEYSAFLNTLIFPKLSGMAWTDTAGTQGEYIIPSGSSFSQDDYTNEMYKRIEFPAGEVYNLKSGVNTKDAMTVLFGTDTEGEPLKWRVIGFNGEGVASESGTMTLIAADNRGSTPFDETANNGYANYYKGSLLQKAVDGIASSFSDAELSAVVPRKLASGEYSEAGADVIAGDEVDGAITWPLSASEANQLSSDLRALEPDNPNWLSGYWWLRTPGDRINFGSYVIGDGTVKIAGTGVGNIYGVRPAVVIDLKKVKSATETQNGWTLKCKEPVCRIDNEYFYTLNDAIRQARIKEYENAVITVLKDTEFDGSEDLYGIDYTIQSGDNSVTITLTGAMKFGSSNASDPARTFILRGNSDKMTSLIITPKLTDGKNAFRPIAVRTNNTLSLQTGVALLDSNFEGGTGGMINVAGGAELNIDGGIIGQCSAKQGGAISVAKNGELNFNNGFIMNCAANQGGAIYVANGGKCTFSGGTIEGCSAEQGGAIFVAYNGECKLYNYAAIQDCRARHDTEATVNGSSTSAAGGAVYVIGTLLMDNGTIRRCVAESGKGGGVYVYPESGCFVLYGGKISECSAIENENKDLYYNDGEGGGAYIGKAIPHVLNGIFSGGTISSNTAATGGGVYIHEGADVEFDNYVKVTGNTFGDVFVTDSDSLVLFNCDFSKNAKIGIMTKTVPSEDSPVRFTAYAYLDCSKYFVPNLENTYVEYDPNDYVLLLKAMTKEEKPAATFNATGEDTAALGNLKAGMIYTVGDGTPTEYTGSGDVQLSGLEPCSITVYMPGNGATTSSSDVQTIEVKRAATPALKPTQPATVNDKGAIPTTTAHQISTDGVNWTDCSGASSNLNEGVYYVRVKANGNNLASEAQEILIEVKSFNIKFTDYDGTVLESMTLKCGETPSYTGSEPVRLATQEKSFKFAGWNTPVKPVTEEATYVATYTESINNYKVTFVTDGGSDVNEQTVPYGSAASEPEKPEKKSFAFAGWYADQELSVPFDFASGIVGDTTVYAKWEAVTYPATNGETCSWMKGSGEDMVFTFKRSHNDETCFEHFKNVLADGKTLTKDKDYTAGKGSTVITLKAETLEALSAGEHTLTVVFDDAESEIRLTIKEAPASHQTGDDLVMWIGLMVLCVLCGVSAYSIGKKKKVFGK
ncbi:MAG: InlB B-repeat-containing protein [Clostridia bacterium]|nr:InlB B-repeat-containing protein [Clostridia bacterium]